MRSLRRLRRNALTALAAMALALVWLLLGSGTAARAANAYIEVNPSTAEAGSRVDLRANCDDRNERQATAESEAFGRVMLRPDNGTLTGAVTIPDSTGPGTYDVRLLCDNNQENARTQLTIVNMSKPSQGPATGGGGTADEGFPPTVLAGGVAAVLIGAMLGFNAVRRNRGGLHH